MQVHKITLTVIDHDGVGIDGVIDAIENARYPNRCIMPNIIASATADCGEWHDDHPLNSSSTSEAEIVRLFGVK